MSSQAPPQPSPSSKPSAGGLTFLDAGGQMGALIRSIDWSGTPLGAVEHWPQSLRTSVSTMLRSPYPIILFWGAELCMLYNDPFRPILGEKHPATMGARGREALSEAWTLLGPLMRRALDTGEPIFVEDGNVNFERRPGGLKEEAYFTWSYNPTIGESGEIAGLFAIASETTRQVVGDRRLAVLRELSIRTALEREVAGVFRSLEEVLEQAGADVPFALVYALTPDRADLVACAGLSRGTAAAPVDGRGAPWPLEEVARSGTETLLEGLDVSIGPLPGGPWPEPSTRALVLPVSMGGDASATLVLVTGLSPLRPLDEEYRGFLQLLARQVAASVSSARAYEQEKQKAAALAELDRAKTEFFSNVSHEFRTPLTLIVGPIEDALATGEALSRERLELVRRNALRLRRMVNTLLEFSRIEAGRAQAAFSAIDLSAYTRELAGMFQSAIESSGLSMVVECPPLPEAVYVDPEMWERIVYNLLSNAVKYTHQGEIRVSMRWEDSHALLAVTDTGVGIPESELPHIFERFHRIRGASGRSDEGTGIGLALVQELVRIQGATVAVRSRVGAGTTVTVALKSGSAHLAPEHIVERAAQPRHSAATAASYVEEIRRWSAADHRESEPAHTGDAPPGPAADLRPDRILLADDNADLRDYVTGILRREFRSVATAADGAQALDMARSLHPDLILSDVMMPRLDGFGLVRELRRDPLTAAIPIILLSARAGEEATVDGLASGADDYLVKPFSSRELLARIHTHLAMARLRRRAATQELVEQDLRQTIRMRDEFLSLASHELRTPLTTLGLQLESLIRSARDRNGPAAEPDLFLDRLGRARRQTLRLGSLVEALLDSLDIVSATQTATEPLDLAAVAREVLDRFTDAAASAATPLRLQATSTPGYWQRGRLELIVTHLVQNAIKFGTGSPIDVSVSAGADAEGTRQVARITVTDRGIGIAPDQQERIFQRLERGVPIDHYGGFGLGLWIVRQLVQAMKGTIRVNSAVGAGATFTVELPA